MVGLQGQKISRIGKFIDSESELIVMRSMEGEMEYFSESNFRNRKTILEINNVTVMLLIS